LLDPPPEEETRTGKSPETAGDEVSGRTDGTGKAKNAPGTAVPFLDETASRENAPERTQKKTNQPEEPLELLTTRAPAETAPKEEASLVRSPNDNEAFPTAQTKYCRL
jgi:hypothetical protein